MNLNQRCGNCYYWRTQEGQSLLDPPLSMDRGRLGECHRYPPRIPIGNFECAWENEWCGEWNHKHEQT